MRVRYNYVLLYYWLFQVQELNKQIEEEKQRHLEALQKQSGGDNSQGSKKSWSEAEIQCMIKAVNLFPAGTKERSDINYRLRAPILRWKLKHI